MTNEPTRRFEIIETARHEIDVPLSVFKEADPELSEQEVVEEYFCDLDATENGFQEVTDREVGEL